MINIDGGYIVIPCYNKPFGCNNTATDKHHCLSQTKSNIRKYGKKTIDDKRNIRFFCNACHASHAKIPSWLIWNEQKFVEMIGKQDKYQMSAENDPAREYDGL